MCAKQIHERPSEARELVHIFSLERTQFQTLECSIERTNTVFTHTEHLFHHNHVDDRSCMIESLHFTQLLVGLLA